MSRGGTPGGGDNAAVRALHGLLDAADRRWRLRMGLLDAGATLLALLLTVAVAAGMIAGARFAPEVVVAQRALVWGLGLFALLCLAGVVFKRRRDRRTVARYLESREPALDGLLLTALEGESRSGEGLWPAVTRRAVQQGKSLGLPRRVEREGIRRASSLLLVLVLLVAGGVALAPPGWRHATTLLLPGSAADAPPPWTLAVTPGDVTRVAGSDQRVTAVFEGIGVRDARLLSRADGEHAWAPSPMLRGADGVFEGFLFDLQEPTEYRVQAESLESAGFRVSLLPRPRVERIDLVYRFPEATGRAPERRLDAGVIDAVRGSRVTLEIQPRAPVPAGVLVLDDERRVPLTRADGRLTAELLLERDGRYRVELDPGDGSLLPASPEYPIRARVDQPPVVEVRRPGRDTQATRIEELDIEVSARDDVAVRGLELVLSVNGGEERVLALTDGVAAELSAVHPLHLEQHPLEAGDLVAFYARAADGGDGGARRVSSDLYFIEVRPFDREFRQSGGGGGGGGGAGGQAEQTGLARQQRELVVALFNVKRDTALEETTRRERIGLLGEAQARVRGRVDAIVRRLGSRSVVSMNPGYRAMAQELPRASAAMLRVEALLAAADEGAALEPARRALRHLQRADAAFREVQVAQQNAGAQGSSGASEAGDLANLFALEMDRFRDQYSSVQRGRWGQPETRETDDLAERLRQLAERQQREVERLERRRQRGEAGTGGGSQQALAEELERVTRELERLTRERPPDDSLGEALERARAATQAMRRAAEQGSDEAGRTALRRLGEAGRALEGVNGERLAGEAGRAGREAERLARAQRAVADNVREGVNEARGRQLAERKQSMIEALEALRADVDRLAVESREESPVAARELRGAAESLDARGLREGLRRSRDRLVHNPGGVKAEDEEGMADLLDAAAAQIASAAGVLAGDGEDAERRADGAAEQIARLRGELETLQRRLEGETGSVHGGVAPDGEQAPGRQGVGGTSSGGTAPGANASGPSAGGGGVYAGVDAPFRGAVRERAQELDRLRRDLRADSRVARDIAAVVAGLLDLADQQLASTSHTAERHAELLAQLAAVERALAGDGEASRSTDPLARRQDSAPPGWESAVDEYFRSLAADGEASRRDR